MSYDSKSVKVPKSVKWVAMSIADKHARAAFIKLHVDVLRSAASTRIARNRGNRD